MSVLMKVIELFPHFDMFFFYINVTNPPQRLKCNNLTTKHNLARPNEFSIEFNANYPETASTPPFNIIQIQYLYIL